MNTPALLARVTRARNSLAVSWTRKRKKGREMAELQFVVGDGSTAATLVVTGQKTGRNDSCPGGSGKKYKKCHGS